MSSYTGLDMFVHDAKQNFWTWIQFPPSPPYVGRLQSVIFLVSTFESLVVYRAF